MGELPQHIKEVFYKTIKGDQTLGDFEEWLYAGKDLEKRLRPDDYLDLISLDYKKSGAKHELWNLLKKHIDLGEFETYKILNLLREAQQKNERLPHILMEFYDLYCRGYGFLEDLGLGIGLGIEVPILKNVSFHTWKELTTAQQKELLDGFSPELENCIENLIYFFETKKIILTGIQDEMGQYGYQDLRTEEEKKSKIWVIVSEDKLKGSSVSKNIIWDRFT